MSSENWVFVDKYEHRDEAVRVLEKVKAARVGKTYKLVQIAPGTWVEKEIKQPLNNSKTWKK